MRISRPYYLLEKMHWRAGAFIFVSPLFCVVRPNLGVVLFVVFVVWVWFGVVFGVVFCDLFVFACFELWPYFTRPWVPKYGSYYGSLSAATIVMMSAAWDPKKLIVLEAFVTV